MNRMYRAIAPVAFAVAVLSPRIAGAETLDPLRFFEGQTETVGTLKVLMQKPMHTRSVGRGEIEPDGSLSLVQQVEDEGRPARVRHWQIRRVAPGHYSGTMSEASGPVTIDQVGDRYRFRFKMSGTMSVEQWLTPRPDGRSASSTMTVRKFGIAVGSSESVVRKVS